MNWLEQMATDTAIAHTATAVDKAAAYKGPRFERPKLRKTPDAVEREASKATLPSAEVESWAEMALQTPRGVEIQAVMADGAVYSLWQGTPQECQTKLSALRDYQRRAALGYAVPRGYQPPLFILALLGEDVELGIAKR